MMRGKDDTPGASLAQRLTAAHFEVEGDVLSVGGVRVDTLVQRYGSPLYVYDTGIMRANYRRLASAVGDFADVFFSVKANPRADIAAVFVEEGAGLEIASVGEYKVAVNAGCAPQRIIFAGPGKGEDELYATIRSGIGEIHLETFEEIAIAGRIGRELGARVPVSIRVNPAAAAQGGAMRMGGKPAAFGFDEEIIEDVLAAIAGQDTLHLNGVHMFAGTQILKADVLLGQWRHGLMVARRVAELAGGPIATIDLGGGLGVPYHDGDSELDLAAVAAGVPALVEMKQADPLLKDTHIILEPGRYLTANAGLYVMAVRAVKHSRGQRFIVTDGGMHHHLAASGNLGQVIKRDYPIVAASRMAATELAEAHVVGPLCTPLDTLGRQTQLPEVVAGDLIAVLQSGAYGLTASPVHFLSHPMPVEVMVEDGVYRAVGAPTQSRRALASV